MEGGPNLPWSIEVLMPIDTYAGDLTTASHTSPTATKGSIRNRRPTTNATQARREVQWTPACVVPALCVCVCRVGFQLPLVEHEQQESTIEHHFCEPNNNLSRRHPSSDPSLISSHALAHQENNGTYILIKGWNECFNTPTLTGSCQWRHSFPAGLLQRRDIHAISDTSLAPSLQRRALRPPNSS